MRRNGGSTRNPNSLKNLKAPWDKNTADEMREKAIKAKAIRKYNRKLMQEDLARTMAVEIEVPDEIYNGMKNLGIPVHKTERLSKLIMQKALLKGLKQGSTRQLLSLAEFAGYKEPQEVNLKADTTVAQKRDIVINFRKATPEDAQ